MKKSIIIFLIIVLIMPLLSGCGIYDKYVQRPNNEANKVVENDVKEDSTEKVIPKKENRKSVTCTGDIDTNGINIEETFTVNFVDNNATDISFDFTFKVLESDSDLLASFDTINFNDIVEKTFAEKGIPEGKLLMDTERISDTERKISIHGSYQDLIDVFTISEGYDNQFYETNFDSVYENAIKPTAEESDMTCTTNEA